MQKRSEYLPFGRPNFSEAEIEAVSRVMRTGWIGMGPECLAFEAELASFTGAEQVVLVNSCTSALFLALLVKGVGPGDEVICPSLTWLSSANAALYAGADVVFCDVDPETCCITPQTVLPHVTARTRAVVAVHFGGLAADVQALRQVLPPEVAIIEDAAHALGSLYASGEPVGSSGNPVCFSFYANKNLSTGEGGAVALQDAALAARLRSLRLHGLPDDAWKRFSHPEVIIAVQASELGYKMNYTDLQAAIGRIQLQRQPDFFEQRLAVARVYADRLSRTDTGITLQSAILDPGHARHLFLLRLSPGRTTKSRDTVLLELRRRNIGATLHYDPLHRMPLYSARKGSEPGSLPVTETLCREIMTLPISASMTPDDAAQVVDALLDVLST